MKKILLLLSLFVCLQVSGQYKGFTAAAGSGGFVARSADYQAVYNAMATKPTNIIATYQDDMVYSLDSAAYWDRMDYLNVFATSVNTGGEALINWITPGSDADDPTTTTWTALEGYTGNGTDDNISTNWNPTANGSNYTRYSGSVGVYTRNNVAEDPAILGAAQGTLRLSLYPRMAADGVVARINTTADQTGTNTDSRGLFIASRRSDSDIEIYKDGTSIDTETDATTGVPDAELIIFRITGGATYSTRQISLIWLADGVDDTDAGKISVIFNRYMTRIGKNTYNNP